ncbi:hypothetical protein GGD66_002302 [Bradyrhizobium sp. CIR48]|nr:hypothetical protein [Bradyrhizobium sp. CIR48]
MDPVDPFLNSGAWMREYAALQGRNGQREDNPSEQGEFERRLEGLNLDPSDETKSTSPDRALTARGRAVRRDELGGSMRVPPHSAFRESSIGPTRRSVDIPRSQLPALAQVPQSSLRDDLFSSARYTFPDAKPAASTKGGKSRGLWSRFKSGIGKALGGSGSEKSSREAGQSEPSFPTSLRIDYEGSRAGRAGSLPPMRSSSKISETRRWVTSATARSRMRQPICAI